MNKPRYRAWYGKSQPNYSGEVEVIFRNGSVDRGVPWEYRWNHFYFPYDIIAYRRLQ